MFRARPKPYSVRLKSRPKSNHSADHTRPGKHCPAVGQANASRHSAHDQRASRETSLAAAQPVPRTTADASVRAGKNVPRPAEKPSAKSSPPTSRPTMKHPARPFRLGQRPDCPADRPDRPSERRGRPEAVFEAQSAQFKPKAGADLARLGLAAFILRAL
ncbi:unnamed protein product [Microthlaspi erraticum]|uniref:Uncharacterized protein n=1 Tax=Microthlaspi erraticum TaxID=1685480 RepID=A0A6D2HJE0_9BRAS|nr:unnamed protein product [Microthlaspi erraticum]